MLFVFLNHLFELLILALEHVVAVLVGRERCCLDIFEIFLHCVGDYLSDVGVFLDKFWCECLELANEI